MADRVALLHILRILFYDTVKILLNEIMFLFTFVRTLYIASLVVYFRAFIFHKDNDCWTTRFNVSLTKKCS